MCDCTVVQSLPAAGCAGWFMVGDNNKTKNNLANLEASLAPAEAEFGAVAKADQQTYFSNKKQAGAEQCQA